MRNDIFVYICWILTLVLTFIFPTIYTPFIFTILAVYFAEKVKKQDKNKGNKLIIISLFILIVCILLEMFSWYIFLKGFTV